MPWSLDLSKTCRYFDAQVPHLVRKVNRPDQIFLFTNYLSKSLIDIMVPATEELFFTEWQCRQMFKQRPQLVIKLKVCDALG
jgi:hypothetical protein